jgi:hypothetical protein
MDDSNRQHQMPIAALVISAVALVLSCLPGTSWGDAPATDNVDGKPAPEETGLEPAESTRVDQAQDFISHSVDDAAKWIDSFFGDERYVAEEAHSRIRVTPSLFVEEGTSAENTIRVNARLTLPRLNKRLRLLIADTSEDDESILDQPAFSDTGTTSKDSSGIGLQYLLREKDKLNLSISAGLRRGSDDAVDFFIGPRYRRTWALDSWQIRFTERVRWYSDDPGWESRTRFDFERLLRDDLFFRATADLLWDQEDLDDDGFLLALTPALTQLLKNGAGVEYLWSNVYQSRPDFHLDSSTVRIRYRQRIWRKWLFYEVNPQVAFRDEDDFSATPGLEFRLEASFGGDGSRKD